MSHLFSHLFPLLPSPAPTSGGSRSYEKPENRSLCQGEAEAPLFLPFIIAKLSQGQTYEAAEDCSFRRRSLHYCSSEAETYCRLYI